MICTDDMDTAEEPCAIFVSPPLLPSGRSLAYIASSRSTMHYDLQLYKKNMVATYGAGENISSS